MTVILKFQSLAFQKMLQHGKIPSMRRNFIYPHRSIRALHASTGTFVLAALTAIVLTFTIAVNVQPLLSIHNQLCMTLLKWSGMPIAGVSPVEIFAPLGTAPVPIISTQELNRHPLEMWTLFSAGMLVLLELHRRIPFARSFVGFLMTLLIMAAAIVIFYPSSQFGSVEFATMWLRSEVLVWLVLPLFSVSMFVLMQPIKLVGMGWAILTQSFGFVWSSIRLAFCIGVMHYSGILFAPIFWFALGFLADVIYLVVFYSIALQGASRQFWGRRAQ